MRKITTEEPITLFKLDWFDSESDINNKMNYFFGRAFSLLGIRNVPDFKEVLAYLKNNNYIITIQVQKYKMDHSQDSIE